MTDPLPVELWPDVRPDAARRLMAAAVAAFGERGFHATTTRDIAMAAGMSPAALYVHFPSKAAVLSAISRSGHEKALAMVTSAAGGPGLPAARMRTLVAEFVAWHARRHRVARIVQYELSALPQPDYDVVVDLRRQTERVVRGLIEEGVAAGAFTTPDIRSAARAVLSLGIDVARWYTPDAKPDPETLGEQYAALVLSMLGAAA
ncbi:TetR/AcrR family transcriptional regulator [Actinokineospora sp. 24-640]